MSAEATARQANAESNNIDLVRHLIIRILRASHSDFVIVCVHSCLFVSIRG